MNNNIFSIYTRKFLNNSPEFYSVDLDLMYVFVYNRIKGLSGLEDTLAGE